MLYVIAVTTLFGGLWLIAEPVGKFILKRVMAPQDYDLLFGDDEE